MRLSFFEMRLTEFVSWLERFPAAGVSAVSAERPNRRSYHDE